MKNKTYLNNLPWPLIITLAAIGSLKTLVQVLGYHQSEGVLWLATIIVWLSVVIVRKTPRPFMVLLVAGITTGLISVLIQQIAWSGYWDHSMTVTISNAQNNLPFDIVLGDAAIRAIAAVNVLAEATLGGVVLGAIATGLQSLSPTSSKSKAS
jgi:hypothetical protein